MAITRDFLNPIMKSVPFRARPKGFIGALVVALIASINPMSYFIKPYIGAVTWLILSWWFFNDNPNGMIRPKTDATKKPKKTLIKGNPGWYQIIKSLLWGMIFTFIPLFFIYLVLKVLWTMANLFS